MGTSGISECRSLVANTLQKHRWFFNCKCTLEGRHSTHHHARSLIDFYSLTCFLTMHEIKERDGENIICYEEEMVKDIYMDDVQL